MLNLMVMKKQLMKGFTLVELLIVVIILAILAAIVVPQFSSSTNDARLSSLDTTLSNIRAAIDLYYQQHGVYPGSAKSNGGTCDTGGADATGSTANSAAAFIAQLTLYTNASGQACTGSGPNFRYGPYLKKTVIPSNPITAANAVLINTVSVGILPMVGTNTTGTGGWKFDTTSGQFIADDTRAVTGGTGTYDAR